MRVCGCDVDKADDRLEQRKFAKENLLNYSFIYMHNNPYHPHNSLITRGETGRGGAGG